MAIQFVNNVDFNANQAQSIRIENLAADPSTELVIGRIIFNTTADTLKQYVADAGSGSPGWVEVGSSSGVETLTAAQGTFISFTAATSAIGDVDLGTFDLSATGTADATKYLRGDNTWSPISGIYDWDIAGDTGTETIVNGDTVTFAGGTNVTTSYDTGTNTLTINSTDQYVGTVTSVGLSMPSAFTVTNSPVTSSGTLTVTGAGSVSQYVDGTGALQTFPTLDNYQYWTLSDGTTSTNITSTSTATFQGTTNEVEVGEASGTITIGLPDDVTITGELTVNGTGQSSFAGQVTIPQTPSADTDAASKHYVDQAVTGALSYQGGYNAATNTPDLDSSPSSSIKKGWTYTVTADGSFFTEQVRVGDVLIAEVDAPTTLADWTTVQNNIDLADLSTVGIGNVNSDTDTNKLGISVSYTSGTADVGLDVDGLTAVTTTPATDDTIVIYDTSASTNKKATLADIATAIDISKGVRISLDGSLAYVTRTEAGGLTTFAVAVNNSSVLSATSALDVKAEITTAAGQTVYADVTRSGTTLSVIFAGSVANATYSALLVDVG
jgi:hypothetical protein